MKNISEFHLLIGLLILNVIQFLWSLWYKNSKKNVEQNHTNNVQSTLLKIDHQLGHTTETIKDDFYRNRKEINSLSAQQRTEIQQTFARLQKQIEQRFETLSQQQKLNQNEAENRLLSVQKTVEKKLVELKNNNHQQLEQMRKTVDEKLSKTLNERLNQSFELVGQQLQAVQTGLGEMKNLATDVGGLKKALTNVKIRGGVGEIQLAMLLEQILAPEQYESNVQTKKSTKDVVEFAIKLPGKTDSLSHIWLPIDAKFPKDAYEMVQNAHENGSPETIQKAQKNLHQTVKKMAKDIHEKYISPPETTDFGIMFLPFENIYAEVVRSASLLEEIQTKHKVIVTGPSTLAAMLNSLQMGFKTLAIQKRSSEVWEVLASVKKEFENFGGMMQKAQKNIQTGLNQLDTVMGVRTRAIQKKLDIVGKIDNRK